MDLMAIRILVLVFAVVFHEAAHGWTAWKLGDSTARDAGRITLNPLPHIDPIGSLVVPILLAVTGSSLMYGWAKPVPVRVGMLNDPENDHPKVAAAGPLSNLLLALLSAIALGLVALVANSVLSEEMLARQGSSSPLYFLIHLFRTSIVLNVFLALFNLVPLPPLDGSWIVSRMLPDRFRWRYENLRRFGFLPVIGFLVLVRYTFVGSVVMGVVHSFFGFFLGIANNIAGLLG
jgi:Zn-dependent protease